MSLARAGSPFQKVHVQVTSAFEKRIDVVNSSVRFRSTRERRGEPKAHLTLKAPIKFNMRDERARKLIAT